jgi:hypothetical protein
LDEFQFDHGAKKFGNVVIVRLDAVESMVVIMPVIWLGSSSTVLVVKDTEGGAQ